MPLFQSKSASGPVVVTKDKDRIVVYTLTAEGVKKLREAGVLTGQDFPSRACAALIRSGQAHSPRLAESSGQVRFDFASDDTSDFLPRCEMTGVTSDVHLVVYGEGNGTVAKLLGPEPRFVLQKVTSLSVPVTILSLAAVNQLEAANKVPVKSTAATTLRAWFRQDFEQAWEKLARDHARSQGVLALGSDTGELPLDEAARH
jgi:hypothetical protein